MFSNHLQRSKKQGAMTVKKFLYGFGQRNKFGWSPFFPVYLIIWFNDCDIFSQGKIHIGNITEKNNLKVFSSPDCFQHHGTFLPFSTVKIRPHFFPTRTIKSCIITFSVALSATGKSKNPFFGISLSSWIHQDKGFLIRFVATNNYSESIMLARGILISSRIR